MDGDSLDLERYLAIPYVAEFYSVETPDGRWLRRAEYPELGCSAEAFSAPDALENLELERVRTIAAMRRRGEEPPMPREPLRSGVAGLSALPVAELIERALGGSA